MEEQKHKTLKQLHALVARYKMPEYAKNLISSGDVTIVCGVTAAGKNTIINYLVENQGYEHVISHTTRKPRINDGVQEENGKEYWFVNPEVMLDLVEKDKFLEVKAVHGDTCYGTSIKAIESVIKKGKHPIMEIDVQGALDLTEVAPSLRPLFVLPPTYDVWMERLASRGNISDADKQKRFLSASMEIQTALDHPAFILTINHEVEETAAEFLAGYDMSSEARSERRKLAAQLKETIRKI